MTTTPATWNTGDGDWFTASNWDETLAGPPPATVHMVPDAGNDVSIPNGNATPITITYSGTDTVNTLTTGNVVLTLGGGSLTLENGGSAGEVDVALGAAVDVAAGTLTLSQNSTLNGTIAGANGTLSIGAATLAIDSPGVTIGTVHLAGSMSAGATAMLGLNLSYGGSVVMDNTLSNLNLNGHTLTLSGTSSLTAGAVTGTGTLIATGSAQILASANNGAVLEVAGGGDLKVSATASGGTLAFGTGGGTLELLGSLRAGTVIQGTGSFFIPDSVIATGSTVDLSNLIFSNWAQPLTIYNSDTVTLMGTAASNHLTGASVATTIIGGSGSDVLTGGAQNDIIDGDGGGDVIDGGGGNNYVYVNGSGGVDSITDCAVLDTTKAAGTGATYLNFGAGYVSRGTPQDTDATFAGATSVVLGTGTSYVFGQAAGEYVYAAPGGNASLYGTTGTDTLYASTGTNYLQGGSGAANLVGGGGSDTLRGGTGANLLIGKGAGTEVLYGAGTNDKLTAANGTNTLVGSVNPSAVDRLTAPGQTKYTPPTSGVDYAYNEGGTLYVTGTGATAQERVYGGSGTTVLLGSETDNRFYGSTSAGANDYFDASISNPNALDVFVEGSGTSTFVGGNGTNYIYGGAGQSDVTIRQGTSYVYTGAANQLLDAGYSNSSPAQATSYLYETAANQHAGRVDEIDHFQPQNTSNGMGTFVFLPHYEQSSTSISDVSGGTGIFTQLGNGTSEIFVAGVSAATVRAQTYFNL